MFNDTFIRSCELVEEYIARLALQVFRLTGLEAVCGDLVSVDEAISRAGLRSDVARVPAAWLLSMLAAREWIETVSDHDKVARYRLAGSLPSLDPMEVLEAQRAHDPSSLPSYSIAAFAGGHYPAVLRGEITGEEALFAPDGFAAWAEYFANSNPLYAISNTMGAFAAEVALPRGGSAVLEIGGGLGSAAEALLERFEKTGRSADLTAYHFTEFAPPFLRRAKRMLTSRFPAHALSFGWVDIDRPFAEAALLPGSFSCVYGVNVLHVARDLATTLAEIRNVLTAGGLLTISECTRPAPGVPVYVEFVFNLLASFRDPILVPAWRPNGGFLTPEQWTAALEANGFTDIKVVPEGTAIREAYPSFVVAAIIARRM